MPDSEATDHPLGSLLAKAERLLPAFAEAISPETADHLCAILADVERRSPHGASLHAQLDTVIKWVRLLADPDSHPRYGGTIRLREHIQLQFRLAQAAADDYTKAT